MVRVLFVTTGLDTGGAVKMLRRIRSILSLPLNFGYQA